MSGTLELLSLELARALQPLEQRLAAGEVRLLFSELGLELPPALEAQVGFMNSALQVGSSAGALAPLIADLTAAIEAEDTVEIIRLGAAIVDVLSRLVPALDDLANALDNVSGSLPGVDPAAVQAFAAALPVRLLDYLIVRYLEDFLPPVVSALALVGLIDIINDPGTPGDPTKPPFTQRRLRLDRLSELLGAPEALLQTLYGWGGTTFDGKLLLERLSRVLTDLAVPAIYEPAATPPALRLLLLRISPRTDVNPRGMEAVLELALPIGTAINLPIIVPHWQLQIGLEAALEAQAGLLLQPPAGVTLIPPSGSVQGRASAAIARLPIPPSDRVLLVGIPGGSGLSAEQISLGLLARLQWDTGAARATGDFGFEGQFKRAKLAISLAGADGFLGTIVGGFGLEVGFDLGIAWTAGGGFTFTGSSTLEVQLPTHISIGPIEITATTLAVGIEAGEFPISLSADIKSQLGPLTAVVQEVGLTVALRFPPGNDGNLGPVDLGFAFKPPKGVGLAIDAGVVKGGGFLLIDPERGEYAGALELVFSGFLTLKAIGLITTRMPDGSKGFSLLVIITAEFGTGVQLGFGFTLLGVGGLLGLNRTTRLEPLMEGVRTGAIDRIMFPTDVVANAQRIISDLRTIFPPQGGTFLIGPMAKLGWGTPPLITASLGLIIEIPGNIAILGVLRVALPASDAAVIVLQVNFAGAIEFDRKRIYFFAALFESRVLFMTIDGEMGLLVAFGDDANFVVSVGGFHPRYRPPPLPFPSPRRVSITLVSSPIARLRVEGYFAVTSNTAQFGARAEVFFGLDSVNVEGELGFDALFIFSPFSFLIEISASFSVKVFGIGLFSARIRGALEGPTPWRAHGEGSVSLLFFDVSADFDVTWGESRDTTLPPIAVMPIAKSEFEKAEAWTAALPASANLLVALRPLPETDPTVVLHPLGVLRITQRRIPLDLTLAKVGNQRPNDVERLSVTVSATGLAKTGDTLEQFAPAQFQDLDDAAKLSRPAFGPEHGGLDISSAGRQVNSSRLVRRIVRYEEIILDSGFKRRRQRFRPFNVALFELFLAGNQIARADISDARAKALQPFAETIGVRDETFTVAFQASNQAYAPAGVSFASEASAREHMQQAVAADPGLAGALHVVPDFELAP